MKKKFVSIMCILAMLCGTAGCGSDTKTEKQKELTVLTEMSFQTNVQNMVSFAKDLDSSINIHVEVLPTESGERETKIQKLRTEIMAGKGPDIYLMDTEVDNASEILEPLFENPYKTMQSGALASLDKYMKDDAYWTDGTYKEEFLNVGKYEGKQYILPLSCSFPVLIGMQGAKEMEGGTLGEWLAQTETSTDEALRMAMRQMSLYNSARWFEPAVDYEKQEVLFDKAKWSDFAASYLTFKQEGQQDEGTGEGPCYAFDNVNLKIMTEDVTFLQNIPDIDGRKNASVKGYGAVGMASDYKKEAYDFLMLFLNESIKNPKGEEAYPANALGCIEKNGTGFPVQESVIEKDSGNEMLLDAFRQIDGAYFVTRSERTMYTDIQEAVNSAFEPGFDPEAGWETTTSGIADKAWNNYKTQVSE